MQHFLPVMALIVCGAQTASTNVHCTVFLSTPVHNICQLPSWCDELGCAMLCCVVSRCAMLCRAMLPRLPEALMRVAPSWTPVGPFTRGSTSSGQPQQPSHGVEIPALAPLRQQLGLLPGAAAAEVKAPVHVLQVCCMAFACISLLRKEVRCSFCMLQFLAHGFSVYYYHMALSSHAIVGLLVVILITHC